ncbi:MAG TPA: nitrilase-related carbon-nitrogen hydrolase, partial [Planctomycetia bacterium]|nr:nitrilase-related carbon-nitrogen hydrolase [Planctomycetia bacterium]
MARTARIAAVSYVPPLHDHRGKGVDLGPLAALVRKLHVHRPDFIVFPELCACVGGGIKKGLDAAPELGPFAEAVGKLARDVGTALVVPFIERASGRFYNSVPIVDSAGKLVLNYRKLYPTVSEMDAGLSPGTDVPVGECDGVTVV